MSFQDFIESIENRIGKEKWIVVYSDINTDNENIFIYSALVPNQNIDKVLVRESWDIHKGQGYPSFGQSSPDFETEYLRFGNFDKIEPIVYYRYFYDIKKTYREISQEFIHLHNLFFDKKNNKYIKVEDDGNEVDVIKISNQKIEIQLSYLKKYLAIKASSLVFYFDVYRRSIKELKDFGIEDKTERVKKENLIYLLDIANNGIYGIPYNPSMNSSSRLLGKKIIEGLKNYKPNYLDFEDKKYLEFIIGIDENGEELFASCNHYNLEPNQYLNPVFFEKDVLSKYFNNPEKYSVLDGLLTCKSLWGMPIDNNHKEFIIVFLGDLGRSLSYKEQQYWKHYNVIPESDLSSTYFKRSFLCEPAPPERNDLTFKMKFEQFRLLWEKKFGWVLFKPLRKEDYHYYKTLRIPLINSISEFEAQVLALTKIIIDSLNEKELGTYLSLSNVKNIRGITKLKEFLKSMKITDFEKHIDFLRDLQKLRSKGIAHRKGDGYDEISQNFNIYTDEFPKIFDTILSKSIDLIDFLTKRLL